VEVNFPLVEDITMEVAKKYGMIQPGESTTKAVRAVFSSTPRGLSRAIIYYPLSLGRNFDELLRVVRACRQPMPSPARHPRTGSPATMSSSLRPAPVASPKSGWKARMIYDVLRLVLLH